MTFFLIAISALIQQHTTTIEGFDFQVDGISRNAFNGGHPISEKSCPDCYTLSNESCVDCDNCGVCISKKGEVKCMPGDMRGPYFESNCKYWINKEDSTIYGNNKKNFLVGSHPWNYLFPKRKWNYGLTSREFVNMPRYN